MTTRNMSFGMNFWHGIVVNVDDPDMDGRIQVRIFGIHDNKTTVPDNSLPWAKPYQDITNAAQNKVGTSPTGIVKGSIVAGFFMDSDMQYPIYTGTVGKAGDPDSSSSTTQNGQVGLANGTNSSPPASRISNNSFITRKGKDPYADDHNTTNPPEQKDSDGVDVTEQGRSATRSASNPTVGSIKNPIGSILNQIQSNDPQLLNSFLPQAISNLIKMKDSTTFNSTAGVTNVLGNMLGSAMSAIGVSNVLNNLANPNQNLSYIMSSITQTALATAITVNAGNASSLSSTVQAVIGTSLPGFILALEALINSGNLNLQTLDALILSFFGQIQNNGQQSTVGANFNNILGLVGTLLPTISGSINSILSGHLPQSVLNSSTVSQALQKFSISQAILKAPTTGKKALATAATIPGATSIQIGNVLSGINGLSSNTTSFIKNLF